MAIIRDFNKEPVFAYTVTGGRVVGEGSKVTWDLSDMGPGFYTATVEVRDKKEHRALASVTVTLQACGDCVNEEPCPAFLVTCSNEVKAGTPVTCTVNLGSFSDPNATRDRIRYEWSVLDSAGADVSGRIGGQGTSISIRTDGMGAQFLTTKVEVKGLDPSCPTTMSASTVVKP